MKPIQLFLIIAISAYASWGLTLQEIQTRLLSQVPYEDDSLEVMSRITMKMLGTEQVLKTYMVRKGPHKMLLEQESSILHLRTITTATKTKVIDLKTGTSQIISTPRRTLDSLQQLSTTVLITNPMDSGTWSEPQWISAEKYMLKSGQTELTWDNRVGKFSEMRIVAQDGWIEFRWEYTETNPMRPSKYTTIVNMNGVESTTDVDFFDLAKFCEFP